MNNNVVYHHIYGKGIIVPFIENVFTRAYSTIVYFPDSLDTSLHDVGETFTEKKYRLFTDVDTYCSKDACNSTKCLIGNRNKINGFYSSLQKIIKEEMLLANKTNC